MSDKRAKVDEEGEWVTAEMECVICGHEWVAVYPVCAPKLECSECGYMNPRHDPFGQERGEPQ